MFAARFDIDLPSELPPPPPSVQRLVRSLVARVSTPEEGFEQLLVDELTLFEGLLRAFEAAGFDDVISVLIDGKPVYVDVENKLGDLDEALDGVVRSKALAEGFSVVRATVSCVDEGVRMLSEARMRARVPEGNDELQIRVRGRVAELEIRKGEQPRDYARRVRAWVADASKLEQTFDRFKAVVSSLREAVDARLPGASIRAKAPTVRVVVPGARQVGRFRHLTFGDAVRPEVYQALPARERIGAYDEPFNRHLYSPYADLLSWIVAGEVMAGRWPRPDVELIHPTGATIATGDQAASIDPSRFEVPRDAVRVGAHGDLVVDDSIPQVASLDPAELGNPHAPGWGGEAWDDAADDAEALDASCGAAG